MIIMMMIDNNNNYYYYSRTVFTLLSCTAKAHARVHSGHLNESGLSPGGLRLVGQAVNLTLASLSKQL